MRVIAGKAKGRSLFSREGDATRPTADYCKEQLFDCLAFSIPGSSFLDLFSGSGAIAIEALSRGAERAVLVEKDPEALKIIRANLQKTGLEAEASVVADTVENALVRLQNEGKSFDFIFMDPPYRRGFEELVISLHPERLLKEDGVFIIESARETEFGFPGWQLIKTKGNKTTRFSFLEYVGEEAAHE